MAEPAAAPVTTTAGALSRRECRAVVEAVFDAVRAILLSQSRALVSEGLPERARSSQEVARRLEGKRAAWLAAAELIRPTRAFVDTLQGLRRDMDNCRMFLETILYAEDRRCVQRFNSALMCQSGALWTYLESVINYPLTSKISCRRKSNLYRKNRIALMNLRGRIPEGDWLELVLSDLKRDFRGRRVSRSTMLKYLQDRVSEVSTDCRLNVINELVLRGEAVYTYDAFGYYQLGTVITGDTIVIENERGLDVRDVYYRFNVWWPGADGHFYIADKKTVMRVVGYSDDSDRSMPVLKEVSSVHRNGATEYPIYHAQWKPQGTHITWDVFSRLLDLIDSLGSRESEAMHRLAFALGNSSPEIIPDDHMTIRNKLLGAISKLKEEPTETMANKLDAALGEVVFPEAVGKSAYYKRWSFNYSMLDSVDEGSTPEEILENMETRLRARLISDICVPGIKMVVDHKKWLNRNGSDRNIIIRYKECPGPNEEWPEVPPVEFEIKYHKISQVTRDPLEAAAAVVGRNKHNFRDVLAKALSRAYTIYARRWLMCVNKIDYGHPVKRLHAAVNNSGLLVPGSCTSVSRPMPSVEGGSTAGPPPPPPSASSRLAVRRPAGHAGAGKSTARLGVAAPHGVEEEEELQPINLGEEGIQM